MFDDANFELGFGTNLFDDTVEVKDNAGFEPIKEDKDDVEIKEVSEVSNVQLGSPFDIFTDKKGINRLGFGDFKFQQEVGGGLDDFPVEEEEQKEEVVEEKVANEKEQTKDGTEKVEVKEEKEENKDDEFGGLDFNQQSEPDLTGIDDMNNRFNDPFSGFGSLGGPFRRTNTFGGRGFRNRGGIGRMSGVNDPCRFDGCTRVIKFHIA